ncbi:exopolyphosphatase / guanosine-5'-triphosphate,3'-diphosphate pyrophosphatase [Pedobacter sp. ok626]|uniref:Ppx/GppA phosphatase family protein n=1 Tax=Pedobacter sp. ok626 TaxID=1761882 RepID=UPI0008805C34|nr:exopolyphosphatase [Pedobacter sp. ok626]SDK38609.1 exopolyphosphatase / guanosine-5'-triphosphate,3'-diphosphate pyrophosphatase [Pedobacter sp. ok626]
MIAAVIDLGTNTFHLIIAEISATEVKVLFKTNEPVRLGQGRINENIIVPEAFERGIATLKAFKQEIIKHQVDVVKATATSAVRSAANGTEFVNAAKKNAGIDIEVISGDQEAAYIFKGVKATGAIQATSLIMDIGGGSTEFIIANADEILWKASYNIGAARLTQAYFHSDPISQADQSAILTHLKETLQELGAACALYKPQHLVGSAGAFESFTGMIDPSIDLNTIKSAPIDLNQYQKLAATLIASTHAEREVMPNLIALRVDMIVIAALISNYVIASCGIKTISLSTYDLKMGVLYELASSAKIKG